MNEAYLMEKIDRLLDGQSKHEVELAVVKKDVQVVKESVRPLADGNVLHRLDAIEQHVASGASIATFINSKSFKALIALIIAVLGALGINTGTHFLH